jgi:prepilin-type N-terminal cleavage/methylation domain-containing protein
MKVPSRSRTGFSLIETLVGMLILALSVVGSFEALRLSDLKIRHARIDNRITELLREHSDYVMYVAYDLLPADGAVLSQGSLYQLYDSTSQSWKSFDSYTVTANVQALNLGTASEIRNITLNMIYQVDGDSPSAQLKTQTIRSDAISRRKP